MKAYIFLSGQNIDLGLFFAAHLDILLCSPIHQFIIYYVPSIHIQLLGKLSATPLSQQLTSGKKH